MLRKIRDGADRNQACLSTRRSRAVLLCGLSIAGLLGGCGSSDSPAAKPLTADQFVNRAASIPPDGGRAAGAPVDRAGAVAYDNPGRVAEQVAPSADPNPNPQRINTTVNDTVRSPYSPNAGASVPQNGSAVSTPPATTRVNLNEPIAAVSPVMTPTTAPAMSVSPQSTDVGFVVMEINGKAIFSDKVLAALERSLAAEAKKNNPKTFRELAKARLEQQVQLYKRDELEVASADLALEAGDKQLAQGLTMQWRQQQITAAGGSLEVARRRAREEGWDFDDLVQQQYRLKLVQIFYQKRIYPRIFVQPADVRAYYERNKDKEFATPGKLKFRVIKIDPREPGFTSPEQAQDLAKKVQERAKTEDFAKLATEVAKDPRGGAIGQPDAGGWVDANSYRYEDVETAVAKLQPGQVTDVILGENRLLFIAKLEAIQDAKAQAFDDPSVQERISQRLRGVQLQLLREQHVRKLELQSVMDRKEGKLNDLLEIVMRRYPEWAKAG